MFNSIFNEGSLFSPLMNRRFTRVSRFAEARTTFWHVLSCLFLISSHFFYCETAADFFYPFLKENGQKDIRGKWRQWCQWSMTVRGVAVRMENEGEGESSEPESWKSWVLKKENLDFLLQWIDVTVRGGEFFWQRLGENRFGILKREEKILTFSKRRNEDGITAILTFLLYCKKKNLLDYYKLVCGWTLT